MSAVKRDERRRETCARKIDYPTWDAAEQASLQIIRDGISPDANGPAPYPCPFGDHYHVGHLRFASGDTTLADERADILARFTAELAKATGDGSKKRRAGTKPPWYADDSHEAAMFSHLMKWKRGELVDPDSGAHPLVHLAWRALGIALIESGNVPD